MARDQGTGRKEALPAAYFDWYSATLEPEVPGEDALSQLRLTFGGRLERRRGRHGYANRVELHQGQRAVVAVSFGGSQPRTLVESSGGDAVQVSEAVRSLWPTHRVTRVDSAMDWDEPQAWDWLASEGLSVARASGVTTSVAGDWLDGNGGRTLYIGGASASTRVRIYEKGRQMPEAGRPDWVRAEVQVRPQKAAKAALAALGASEVWGAARWSQRLSEALTGLPVAKVAMAGWVPPDDARAKVALLRQYGPLLRRMADELGGDWAALGLLLGDELAELA